MNDVNKKINAIVRKERMKKLKVILGIAAVFAFLLWFTYVNDGGASW